MRANRKAISILLCFFLIVYIIFSIIFINEETHHDCSGQSCPICRQLHAAQSVLSTLKRGGGMTLIDIHKYIFIISIMYGINILLRQKTLITMKVELLD